MKCPECSAEFEQTERRQVFCSRAHGKRFYNLQTKRGTIIGPLLVTARTAGRYAGVSRELGAYARREADALISQWIIEDRKAGRDATLIAEQKRTNRWRATDAEN